MKLSHFLAGVAATAMLAGAASAQTFQIDFGEASTTQADRNALASRYFIASELDLSAAAVTGDVSVVLEEGAGAAEWPDTNIQARLTIELTNAVWDRSVVPADLDCAATVQSGGGAGQSSVTFNIADLNVCAGDIEFGGVPAVLTGANANVAFSLNRASTNAVIQSGTSAGDAGALIRAVSGVRRAFTTAAREAQLPGYAALDSTALGSLNLNLGNNIVSATNVPVHINLDEDQLDDTLVTAGSVVATFGDTTGFNLANVAFGGSSAGVVAGNAKTFSLSGAQLADANTAAGTDLALTAAYASPAGGIQEQSITGSVAITPLAASNLTISAQGGTFANITREGADSAIFRWVGDGLTVNRSVFRHTGFVDADGDPLATLPVIRIIVTNASNGDSFNGEYIVPAGALSASAGGEVITNSNTIRSVVGEFGRADIQFFFEQDDIRTERFVIQTNGGLAGAPQD